MAENSKLIDLQNRITALEAGSIHVKNNPTNSIVKPEISKPSYQTKPIEAKV